MGSSGMDSDNRLSCLPWNSDFRWISTTLRFFEELITPGEKLALSSRYLGKIVNLSTWNVEGLAPIGCYEESGLSTRSNQPRSLLLSKLSSLQQIYSFLCWYRRSTEPQLPCLSNMSELKIGPMAVKLLDNKRKTDTAETEDARRSLIIVPHF